LYLWALLTVVICGGPMIQVASHKLSERREWREVGRLRDEPQERQSV
jgi:hypothetical protein